VTLTHLPGWQAGDRGFISASFVAGRPDFTGAFFSIPPAPRSAYGSKYWFTPEVEVPPDSIVPPGQPGWIDYQGAFYQRIQESTAAVSLPDTVQSLRSRNLADLVNPLMFRCGKYSDWFAFGTPDDRRHGHSTADITKLRPAPLGQYYSPRFEDLSPQVVKVDDGKATLRENRLQPQRGVSTKFEEDSSKAENKRRAKAQEGELQRYLERLLPTLAHTTPLLPPGLLPAQVYGIEWKGETGTRGPVLKDGEDVPAPKVYHCGFPRCEAPPDAAGISTKRDGVTAHILLDHLGMVPTCHRCGERFHNISTAHNHVNGKKDRKDSCKAPEGDMELYGFVSVADWERWGRTNEQLGRVSKARLDRRGLDHKNTATGAVHTQTLAELAKHRYTDTGRINDGLNDDGL